MHHQRVNVPKVESARRLSSRHRVWLFGTSAWIVGVIDRSIAIFSGGQFTIAHAIQLVLAIAFFIGWLYLKPAHVLSSLINQPEETANTDNIEVAEVIEDIQPERDVAMTGEAAKD